MEKIIICYEPEIDKETEITMSEAIEQLSSYWKKESIEQMLLSQKPLWTPYCQYKIKQ
jgi:hypothetical protein